MTQYEKMIETPVHKLISFLAIPTVISMLVTAIYNVADTYFVSKLGESVSAAISVVFSLMTLIQSFGFTIGIGSGAIISRSLGRKDEKKACQYASQAVLMGLIVGIILFSFGLAFNGYIMTFLGASKTSKEYAVYYAKWIFIASPFMMLSFIMNNILRSEGKAKLSMVGLGFGGILNIFLDPLFINNFGMGISGAGLATMISQMVSFTILASFFVFRKTTTKIHFKYVTKDLKSYGMALVCGAPTMFRQGFATSANIILNFLGKPYGDSVVAALGITGKVYMFVRNIIIGLGQGYQPVLGYNYGAKRSDRIKKAFKFTLSCQSVVSVIAAIICITCSKYLISFFSDKDDVIKVGMVAIKYLGFSLPLLGFSTIVNQTLQIMGYAKSASFLASLRQGIIYTPVIFLLEGLFGKTGLCLTQPVSDSLTAVVSIPFCIYIFKILKKMNPKEELRRD